MKLEFWLFNSSVPWSSCISQKHTKSSMCDMSSFTCLTTVKLREEECLSAGKERGAGREGEKKDLVENIKVLNFFL